MGIGNINRIDTFINEVLNDTFKINFKCNTYLENNELLVVSEIYGEVTPNSFFVKIDIINYRGEAIVDYVRHHSIDPECFEGIDAVQVRFRCEDILSDICGVRIYPSNRYIESKHFENKWLPVVGLDHGNRRDFVNKLKTNDEVVLIRERDNIYDSNAIKVLDVSGNHLGYIGRDCALIYAKTIDENLINSSRVIEVKKKVLFITSNNMAIDNKNFKPSRR